jgi:hypothetical protein
MTPKYWFRIIFGMLAIFAVGMIIRAGINKGRHVVTDIAHGSGPITVPLLGMGLKLDDVRLGSLQKMRIERDAPKRVAAFRLYGTLDDESALAKFDGCRLTVTNPNDIDENTSFHCASLEDSTSQEMVQFGSVTLMPSGREFVLLIPDAVRRDIQKDADEDMNDVSGGNDSGNVTSESKDGSLDIKVNGKTILQMKGDSNGGMLVVHDESGKKVVDMKVTAPTPPKPAAVKKP